METIKKVKDSTFYRQLNSLLRKELGVIKDKISPKYEQLLTKRNFNTPLPLICQHEHYAAISERVIQWRLELYFDDYQWSHSTMKPHFLTALVSLEIGNDVVHYKYQLCSSFNEQLKPMPFEKIHIHNLDDLTFVNQKLDELKLFLRQLPEAFLNEIKQINFNELEYMMHPKIQEKWKQGFLPGYDCIIMGEGDIIIGNAYSVYNRNTNKTKQYWSAVCDTTLESLEKYNDDIWVACDIFHGAFEYNNQKFVFGDGGMGNEGFVAATSFGNILDWAIFFTFSNPIHKAEVKNDHLICYGDSGVIIDIDLKKITDIKVSHK